MNPEETPVMTSPDLSNWANFTTEERQKALTAYTAANPLNTDEGKARYSARYDACTAMIRPYVIGLGRFECLKTYNHEMYDQGSQWSHEHLVRSLVDAIRGELWIYEAPVVQHLLDRHAAGETISLSRGADALRCHNCGTSANMILMQGNTLTPMEYDRSQPRGVFRYRELTECPVDAKQPYSAEINIPSGVMVMANHLSPLFKEIRLKYSPEKSLNHLWGRKTCTLEYAEQGYIEMNIGNGSCRMYKMDPLGTQFVVGESECVEWHRRAGHPEVADVCTDFWGYGVADLDLANTKGLEAWQKNEKFMTFNMVTCKPGRYRFTHRYHLCGDSGSEIYTHVEWISEVP